MDKRFVIIHKSDIIRKGLWAILREAFHYEFILLASVTDITNYSGFVKTEFYILLEAESYSLFVEKQIQKSLGASNNINIIKIQSKLQNDSQGALISINDSSDKIISEIKNHTENKEEVKNGFSDLSEREKDVLSQVALGHTNKEIADLLFISIHTVITHRKHITDKLGIKSISGLTVYAILNKLIDTENIDPASLI